MVGSPRPPAAAHCHSCLGPTPQVVSRAGARRVVSVRAQATAAKLAKTAVPLKLEEGEMPLNTFNNKKPFVAKIKSVEKIVGPKATGETCHIIIETNVRSSWLHIAWPHIARPRTHSTTHASQIHRLCWLRRVTSPSGRASPTASSPR